MEFVNATDPRFAEWRKAPQSGPSEGCLYVSRAGDGSGDVALAESTDGERGPVIVLSRRSWEAFLEGAKTGAFDDI